MIGPTRLGAHNCANTRLFPDTFVPRHDCAQTRFWQNKFVPGHTNVSGHNRVGSSMYGHKRVVSKWVQKRQSINTFYHALTYFAIIDKDNADHSSFVMYFEMLSD